MKLKGRRQSKNVIDASQNEAAYNVKSALEDAGKGLSAVTNARKQIKDEPFDIQTFYSNQIVRSKPESFAKKLAFEDRFNAKHIPVKSIEIEDNFQETPNKGPIPKKKPKK
jgi:hypothetical protein